MGWPSNESLKPPVNRLKASITMKKPPIIDNKSKFFIKNTSRRLPAKQALFFWAIAPNKSPAAKDTRTGACMLPGPVSLLANNAVTLYNRSKTIRSTGSTAPDPFDDG